MQLLHRNVQPFSLISSQSSTYSRLHCFSLNSSSLRHVTITKSFIKWSRYLSVIGMLCRSLSFLAGVQLLLVSIAPLSTLHLFVMGRYNMVGAQPSREIVVKEHIMTILDHYAGNLTEKMVEDPMTIPASISNGWKPGLIDDELPDTFCGEDLFSLIVVSGELLDHLTCWDELRAVLPVGTICGAPKVKAIELIDQLEVGRRGPYSDGFGGISFSGDMDIGLVLRTMVFMNGPRYDTMYSYTHASKCQEWVAHLQSEAQIVADSDPDEKQKECEDRVACLCRVIDLAESTFVKGKSSVLETNGSVPNLFSMARVHEKKKLTSQMK